MKNLLILIIVLFVLGCDQSDDTSNKSENASADVEETTTERASSEGDIEQASEPEYRKVTEKEKQAHLTSIEVEKTLNPDLGAEQANVAVNLFNQVCVKNIKKADERIEYLNSNYTKHEGASRDLFLGLFRVKSGDSWAAVFSKGIYAIVVDDNGNCHVAALYADDKQIHDNIKNIYEGLKTMPAKPDIRYNTVSKGDFLDTSGFDFMDANGSKDTSIVVSTHPNPPEGKPAALLTMNIVTP